MDYDSGILRLLSDVRICFDIMYATYEDLYENKPPLASQPISFRRILVWKTNYLLVCYQVLKNQNLLYCI